MKSDEAIKKITEIIVKHACPDRETALDTAKKIYADVVAIAVEHERDSWVVLHSADQSINN